MTPEANCNFRALYQKLVEQLFASVEGDQKKVELIEMEVRRELTKGTGNPCAEKKG